jgi:TolA-binding protein
MKSNYIAFSALLLSLFLTACQPMRNFTTYYNRFYNMERIMDEAEDELLYIREQKTPEPTYYIPYDDLGLKGARVYNHLERRSMSVEEMKANKIKLDSILIKGSMLLVRNTKSDYVPDAVFYMGKAFFYEREWYQSQKKCEELIANFPESRWFPDAHLFLSMNLLEQGDVDGAEKILSRTIDIAWGQERRDLLTEAFRLNADINLAKGEMEKAIKPYQRAILLSSDNEEKARWQYEIGVVRFRSGDFQGALREFDRVREFSPDILTQFQTGLQRSVTLRTLGERDLAAQQLAKLSDNSNFEPWWGMVAMEKMNLDADQPGGASPSDEELKTLDSTYPGKTYAAYSIYERGVRAYRAGDYRTAYNNFWKVQSAMAPFQRRAQRYALLLGQYIDQNERVYNLTRIPLQSYPDSTKANVSDAYYNIARVFASLGIPDSLNRYYALSSQWAPGGSLQAARALYARAAAAHESGRSAEADSLLELVVHDYPLTDYAADARTRLGYTEAAKIDPARDLYESGLSFMKVGEYTHAIPQFQRVANEYKDSPFAPQALYAIGLLYERTLDNYDSAFSYYSQILNRYPNSEQGIAVKPLIEAVLGARMRRQQDAPGEEKLNDAVPQGADSTGTKKLRINPDGLVPLSQSDDPSAMVQKVEKVETDPAGGTTAPGETPPAEGADVTGPARKPTKRLPADRRPN